MNDLPDWLRPPTRRPSSAARQPKMPPEMAEMLAELEKRKNNFDSLAQFCLAYTPFVPALHHRLICDGIDSLIDDEYDVLVVMSPPASAKSSYVSVAAPAYIIGRNPTAKIISVSRAAELASDFGGRVKNIVESAEYQRDNSHTRVAQDTRAKDNWKTTEGGSYFAVGASGGVLGKRADWVICDDIHTSFEDAQSETQLAKIRNWFESDLLSRMPPTGKLVVIGQRLNANDIIGYTIQRSLENPAIRLKVLKFTAVALPDVSPDSPDVLGRTAPDERMWPDFYTDTYLDDKRRDEFIWKTLWMQEPPSASGDWVGPEDIRHRPSPRLTPTTVTYGCSDLALSVNTGDYTVHFIVAVDSVGDFDILDARRSRVDPDRTSNDICELAAIYKPREWLIDDDNMAKVMIPLVATKARELSVSVPWKMMKMRGQDKETRAAPLRGLFKRGKIYYDPQSHFAGWLTRELLMFPNAVGSGVDDGIDALSVLGRRVAAIAPAVPIVAPTVKQGYSLDDLWKTPNNRASKRI